MIRELQITNLGVIERTRLEFEPGLTVLTGETGAGKTLIITALSLLLGAKPEGALIRHGADEALIECTMDLPTDPEISARLEEIQAASDAGEIIVTRTVAARSRALVGGRATAASLLAETVGAAITLHGQHGQTRLTHAAEQRAIVDGADPAIAPVLEIVRDAWRNLAEARALLQSTTAERETIARTLAQLQAFVDDIEAVAPEADEDVALDATIATLSSIDEVMRAAGAAVEALVGGDEATGGDLSSRLGLVRRQFEHMAGVPEFAVWLERIVELAESTQALGQEIGRFVDRLDDDPAALDAALARRAQIGALLRRHGGTLAELRARHDEAGRAIALAKDPEARIAALQALVEQGAAELEAAVEQLHVLRVAAGSALAARVTEELHALGLVHARFSVDVRRNGAPGPSGDDVVEFRFSANPGMPEQPLALVGSGGELSRVMLALETTLRSEQGRTFVFDEIDAGIGGAAAVEVGRRLATLARRHQVIVVTHLAQVAAFADAHVVVEKSVQEGLTTTRTRRLPEGERAPELARMLSGASTEAAVAHARELIEAASAARRDRP